MAIKLKKEEMERKGSKKEYFLPDGTQIRLGDFITMTTVIHGKEGDFKIQESGYLSPELIETLIKEGVVKVQETRKSSLADVISYMADKRGFSLQKTVDMLVLLIEYFPTQAASVFLKEVALYMDSKYPDNIRKSPELWVISSTTRTVRKLNKEAILDYKGFAAFRTQEEALEALELMEEFENCYRVD